jgi:uncharacterized protein (TIGR02466 family)
MFDSFIQPLFPSALYISNLERNLTQEEKEFISSNKNKVYKNQGGNSTSQDTYILKNEKMKNLKKNLEDRVNDYFEKIICTTDAVKPYITQSWLNFNNINEYHHQHYHENSLISGVFYVQCLENEDSIKFLKNKPNIIEFTNFKNYNLYNSGQWEISIRPGLIVLFPSSITHKVDLNKNNHTRISLAFNVFVTGTLGDKARLTQLEV